MSTPKERPILFSSTMVRAILDGSKTQTRRIIKNQPEIDDRGYISDSYWINKPFEGLLLPKIDDLVMYCPYGKPGDRLWVRETWGVCTKGADIMAGTHWENPLYRADADAYGLLGHDGVGPIYQEDVLWKPSIHMPRLASRINLEITGIRIERLQDISEEDAISEGAQWTDNGRRAWAKENATFEELNPVNGWEEGWSHTGETDKSKCLSSARNSYGNLWESINGKGSWDLNPFVWVVEFKVI